MKILQKGRSSEIASVPPPFRNSDHLDLFGQNEPVGRSSVDADARVHRDEDGGAVKAPMHGPDEFLHHLPSPAEIGRQMDGEVGRVGVGQQEVGLIGVEEDVAVEAEARREMTRPADAGVDGDPERGFFGPLLLIGTVADEDDLVLVDRRRLKAVLFPPEKGFIREFLRDCAGNFS